ncbi:hypothetical protein LSTR_LSTR004382 [Laodelphax striatellus]|uniref:Uncharacterized protein n=1 Tax=Laodelphax striatellus TaxID=195883 RepID=A0A482X909_LAOST|nr:hypothetical protein LSTR_LSTR004382 [Laodelphax striatellus]
MHPAASCRLSAAVHRTENNNDSSREDRERQPSSPTTTQPVKLQADDKPTTNLARASTVSNMSTEILFKVPFGIRTYNS